MDFHAVDNAFQEAVNQGVFPGAVLLVSKDQQVVHERAYGHRATLPEKLPLAVETVFDVASLTKPLATTIAFMLLVQEKKIRLDDQVTVGEVIDLHRRLQQRRQFHEFLAARPLDRSVETRDLERLLRAFGQSGFIHVHQRYRHPPFHRSRRYSVPHDSASDHADLPDRGKEQPP